jgi:hypothetical protein
MTDEQMQEIYTLARLAFQGGQRSFQVQAFPFRMTPQNIAAHRNDPNMEFWRMLKVGYDHFEVTHQEPKIDVCSRRYVFDSIPQPGVRFSPTGMCPPMTVPEPIRVAVAEKEKKDKEEVEVIAAHLEAQQERALERGWDTAESEAMLAAAPAAETAAAPMSVASIPVSLDPKESAAAADAAAPGGAAAPATVAQQQSAPQSNLATAYANEQSGSGISGFFTRVLKKVNPF